MDSEKMFEMADRLRGLRDEKAELEKRMKEINGEITRAGMMFCLTSKTRASAAAGRKEELFAALRGEGFGDLVYETVNANSLSAFVKEQIEENGDVLPEWLDGLVNVFEKTSVSLRKAAK